MASTLTLTSSKVGSLGKYSMAWLSHTDGTISNTVSLPLSELQAVEYVPDAGGTQPSDLYDLTMTGPAGGADVLGGTGANLSQTNASQVVPAVSTYFRRLLTPGTYTLVGANCGNAKGGTVIFWLRPL